MSVLEVALDPATVIVAVDPGKVSNRVWVSDGSGLLVDPVSLPVAREGISRLERLLEEHAAVDPGTCWSRAIPTAGLTDRAGGVGVRGSIRRSATTIAVVDVPGPRTLDREYRAVLGAAVAWMPAAAGRCRSTRSTAWS